MDIRAAIQEKDNTKGHGTISTLANDIRTLNSNNRVVKWYRDPDDGEYKIYTAPQLSTSTSVTAPMTGIEGKELIAYFMPSSCTSIGASAFANNTTVQYINFENITAIGNTAFSGTTNLTMSARFPNLTAPSNAAFQNCRFNEILDLGKITSIGYTASAGGCFVNSRVKKVVFPSTFTSIGQSAFSGCTYLEEAIFQGDRAVNVVRESFYNCTNLKSLGSLKISGFDGLRAFYGCRSLTTLDFSTSGFVTFGYNASANGETFANCTGLTTLTLPTSCTILAYRVLNGCTNLTTINGLDRIQTVGNGSCMGCTKLGGELLNAAVKTIAAYGFSSCKFTKIVLPNIISTGGTNATTTSGAFYNNNTMTYAEFGPNCTTIGYRTFANCSSLQTFVCRAETPPTLQTNVFLNTPATLKIYVPYSSDDSIINAYKTASNWSAQASKIYSLDENGEIPV